MTLTWAGWLFMLSAWGTIAGLTAYCMWKVLMTTEKKKRRGDEQAVIITP